MIVYECRSFLYRNFSCEDLVFVCAILYVCTVLDLRFYNFIFFCGSNHSIVRAFFGLSEIARLFVAVVSMLFVVARTVRDFCGSFDVLSSNFGGTTANFPKINRFMAILRHFPFSVNLYIVICALCGGSF